MSEGYVVRIATRKFQFLDYRFECRLILERQTKAIFTVGHFDLLDRCLSLCTEMPWLEQ